MTKQIIAVGGGKGGVGKSIIAANLAVTMSQAGVSTALVDADLGGANLHTLFGIDRPKHLLEHFISGRITDLNEALLSTGIDKLGIVCGGMPVLGTANPKFSQKTKLIRHIRRLNADAIVLDIGAGIGFNALDLFNAAEYKIAAFVPQLTSLHNGYGFLKAAVHRLLERLMSEQTRTYLHSSNPEVGQESLRRVIARIAGEDTAEADKMRVILSEQQVFLVGNMMRSDRDKNVVAALQQMIRDHLAIESNILGTLKYGEKIERSVNERRPFMLSAGIESNAEVFRTMAQKLIQAHRIGQDRRPSRPAIAPEGREAQATKTSHFDRKEPRYPTPRIPAILTDTGGTVYSGHLQDISHGGALTLFSSPLPVPAAGILVIGPLRGGGHIKVRVEERHRSRTEPRVGFIFVKPNRQASAALEELVAETAAALVVRRDSEVD